METLEEAHGDSPQAEYLRRSQERAEARERYARQDVRIGNGRLLTFGVGALIAWLAFREGLFSGWWLLAPAGFFLALAVVHERVIQKRRRATRAVAFYESGLHRLAGSWVGRGVAGRQFLDAAHPYAEDFDLFGTGSLFELLCTARTQAGEARLADWLRAPAAPNTIRARQAAVEELRDRLDLREAFALLGEEVRSAVDADALAHWGASPIALQSVRIRFVAALLAAVTIGTLLGVFTGLGTLPFLVAVVVEQAFALPFLKRIRTVMRGVEKPARDLRLFSQLLALLEGESFQSPLLQELRAALETNGSPPSVEIARLQTLVDYLAAQYNQLFAPIGFLLLWPLQFTFAIEGWRAKHSTALERWLRVVGEFEALSSLAGYAYEHPDDPFPEIAEDDACFEAEGMTHPMLPALSAVRNTIRLNAETRLFVVSGSNMSGKSTFLRTIGVNVVLALAGAPVHARRLRVSTLQLGASIRTQDSLQGGISRFYAEIKRLRQIVDIAGNSPPPLLFLLDEIMHGTNSHDRLIGAEAVVRTLLAKGALGLVTTHDLALARIVEDPTLHAVNVHFADHLENGLMTFDYALQPGVVAKSNALELMRAVGLEV